MASDIYHDSFRRWLKIKPYVRPFVKNHDAEELYELTKRYVDFLWPLARVMPRNSFVRLIPE